MKYSVIAALLPAIVSASPVACPAPAPTPETFTLISIHSGDQHVHNQPINANGGLLWVGRPTTSFCPSSPVITCPAGTISAFTGVIGTGGISTSHEVPGIQELYIQGPTDNTPGALSFNQAHVATKPGSITDKFTLTTTNLSYGNVGWLACPAQGAYYITTVEDSKFCIGVNLHVIPYTGPTPAAWQYE